MTEGDDTESTTPRNLRFLLILEEVARVGVPMTPTEINQNIGLPKQTLHRLFATLESEGFLQRELDGRTYSPGPRMRAMSVGILSSARAQAARLMVMEGLAASIGETCNLVIPDRLDMLYVDRVETNWPLRIQFPIGSHVPFYCTASGKLYLASLPAAQLRPMVKACKFVKLAKNTITSPAKLLAEVERIREQGYSTDNQEFVDGMIAVATAITDPQGNMVASLAFHAPTPRMDLGQALAHLDTLKKAAVELSRILGNDM